MDTAKAGVIIARFQVPTLHEGHLHLIRYVGVRHERVIVLLGDRTMQANERHPLNFETRSLMLKGAFPKIEVYRLVDRGDNATWSMAVDTQLASVKADGALLYGARDSFIPYYSGKHVCVEVPTLKEFSGTAMRENDCHPTDSVDFRRGMIYQAARRYPQGHPTVDIALTRIVRRTRQVLLGKRHARDEYLRFPGGFFDPLCDTSLEAAASRELHEETHVVVSKEQMRYVGSRVVDDWRYADSKDRIVTSLFTVATTAAEPRAGDDLAAVVWHPVASLHAMIWPGHKPLADMLVKHFR